MKFFNLSAMLCLFLALLACSFVSAQEDGNDDNNRYKPCPCPRNYDPVCASNQFTYSNRCEYDCVRRQVERSGRSLGIMRSGPC